MNLFSKKKKFERKVSLKRETRDGILSYCKMSHPDEGILILRGKSEHGNVIYILDQARLSGISEIVFSVKPKT